MKTLVLALLTLSLMSCGRTQVMERDRPTKPIPTPPTENTPTGLPEVKPSDDLSDNLSPIGPDGTDDAVVRARIIYNVTADEQSFISKVLQLVLPYSWAATASTTITYTNAPNVTFTVNNANFIAGTMTGDTLSLGNLSLTALDDNHLKVCNPGGNTKCTNAAIRMYTTGSVAGFVHQSDNYGLPVYAGTLNPSTALGLNAVGSVQVQTLTIAGNKKRVKLSDFPTPTYAVTSDFTNAGSGSYSMSLVLEYVLLP